MMSISVGVLSFLMGIWVDTVVYPKSPFAVIVITYVEIFFMACIFLYACIVAYKKIPVSRYAIYVTIHVTYYWLSSHFYYEFFMK